MTNVPAPPDKDGRERTRSSTHGRNLPILVVSAFLLGGARILYNSLIQPYALLLGASIAIVGVLVSISEFSMMLPMLIFGELSDAIGRRRPMLIASLLLIVAGILFMTAQNWLVLIIPVLLTGFAFSMNQPAANAATAESVPGNRRGWAFSSRNVGRRMAGVVATLLGISFLRRGSIQNAFVLFTVFVLLNLGLIYFMLSESLFTHRPVSRLFQNIRKNWRIPNPKLKPLYFYVVITDSFAFGTGWHLIYGLLANFQGVTSQTILLYTLLSSIAGAIFQFGLAGRVADHSRKWSIVLSDSIAIPSVLLIALFPGELIFPIGFVMMGIAASFWGPGVQAFVVDHVAPERIAAEFGKLWGLRGVLGLIPPILGGLLAEAYGYSAPLLAGVFFGAISISVSIFFLDRHRSVSP